MTYINIRVNKINLLYKNIIILEKLINKNNFE